MACLSQVMTNLYLAPFPRPATSLIADYPYEQGHKGWQVAVICCTQLPLMLMPTSAVRPDPLREGPYRKHHGTSRELLPVQADGWFANGLNADLKLMEKVQQTDRMLP